MNANVRVPSLKDRKVKGGQSVGSEEDEYVVKVILGSLNGSYPRLFNLLPKRLS